MKKYKIELKGGKPPMETFADLYKKDSDYHLFYQKDGERELYWFTSSKEDFVSLDNESLLDMNSIRFGYFK